MALRSGPAGASCARSPSLLGARARERRRPVHAARIALRDDRHPRLLVVAYVDHAVESLAHLLDVRDEDDLLEPVLQPAQQLDDVLTPRLVQRAEHLVENQQREALPRALG